MVEEQVPWHVAMPFAQLTACLYRINLYAERALLKTLKNMNDEVDKINTDIDSIRIGDDEILAIKRSSIDRLNNQVSFITHQSETIKNSIIYLSNLTTEYLQIKTRDIDIKHVCPQKKLSNKYTGQKMLKYLIFGWIRQLIEDKYRFIVIPYYLKMLCKEFYGNIIIDTNILNVNQLNTIGYVLKSTFNLSPCQEFYGHKIYDWKTDGIQKCGIFCNKSICILKSNKGHIFTSFYINQQIVGCILKSPQSPISTIPMIYNISEDIEGADVYHFSNEFEANFNSKFSHNVTKRDDSVLYSIENAPDMNNKLCISECEMFHVY